MTLEDIPEMLGDWRAGDLRFEDVYFLCLDLLELHEVETVFTALPSGLRDEIAARLRNDWDNDASSADCVVFDSARGIHPATKIIVDRARRWIANSPRPS